MNHPSFTGKQGVVSPGDKPRGRRLAPPALKAHQITKKDSSGSAGFSAEQAMAPDCS